MRRFDTYEIASQRQKVEDKYLLGQLTYLERKLKGKTSMSVKRKSMKVGSVVVSASPVCMVKPELVEP